MSAVALEKAVDSAERSPTAVAAGVDDEELKSKGTAAVSTAATAATATRAKSRAEARKKRDPHVRYAIVDAAEVLYDELVGGITTRVGFKASHAGRKRLSEDDQRDSSFHFGEALFRPVACAIEKVKRKYRGLPSEGGGVFYDLGSGTGKVCVAAALTHRFDRVVGIEILPELNAWGKEVESRFAGSPHPSTQGIEFCMVLGDIRDEPWWDDADLVFCNTLAFSDALLEAVAERLGRLKPGVIILHSGRINEMAAFKRDFELLEFGFHTFSWGSSSIWYHRRKSS